MPAGLTAADRKLLWAAGAIAALLLATTAAFSPSITGPSSPAPSTYSGSSGGALAAYLLLVDLHYPVRRWEEPPSSLTIPGRVTLLIIAEPTEPPSAKDRASLIHFVESGGRILFCGDSVRSFFPDAKLSAPDTDPEWKEFYPTLPSFVARAADTIVMRPASFWGDLSSSQLQLYGDHGSPARSAVVVAWRIGAGEILWWAAATPLTNAGITRADNLKLFLNTVSASSSAEPVSIYWDEYFHGQRGSLWSYVEKTPIVWGGLQLAIFLAGALFTFSRRSGPIFTPGVVSRLSPLEFVETMGGLYQRAGAASIPVAVSYRRLRMELARRLGSGSGVVDSELAQNARARLGLDDQLAEALNDAALASNQKKLPAGRALGLVQRLDGYIRQLRGLKGLAAEQKREEKN